MQHAYQTIPSVYFVGNYDNGPFDRSNPRWLGEWSKNELYENLTEYGNLVLLSDGEAGPSLAVIEGLAAGLGVVISAKAMSGIDTSLPFVDVIPEDKLSDLVYIESVIESNRATSVTMRDRIREYAIKTYSYTHLVENYIKILNNLLL